MSLTTSAHWMYSSGSSFYPYTIDNSLRFNDGDAARLADTMGTPTNTDIATISVWVKRGTLSGVNQQIIGGYNGSSGTSSSIYFDSSNRLHVAFGGGGGALTTNALFRDVSAWYHIVVVFNSTESNSTNRCKLYVNGQRITSFASSSYPSLNQDNHMFSSGSNHRIGSNWNNSGNFFDGYMAEFNGIDGTALTSNSFGETKDGIWVPKEISGLTYGNNGFRLDFANSSAIGNDVSGNNNDWASTNFAATDVVPDSPTNSFAVLQPTAFVNIGGANSAQTLSEGNLRFTGTSNEGRGTPGTIRVTSGKYYVEAAKVAGSGPVVMDFVVNDARVADRNTSTTGGIIIGAVDVDAGKYWSGLNNTWDGSGNPATGANPTGTFTPNSSFTFTGRSYNTSRTGVFNFGQDSSFAGNKTSGSANASDANGIGDFYYTPPTDYLTMCSANLSEPEIIDASEYFNTALYTGTGASNDISVGHATDLVWIKHRGSAYHHRLADTVRGATKHLYSSLTNAEGTDTTEVTGFGSDGFTVGSSLAVNEGSGSLVAWSWKAGTAVSGNTTGSGTAKAYSGSVNTEAGFSIIKYVGNGTAGHTIPHHLGKAPTFIIVKEINTANNWRVWGTGVSIAKALGLNTTNAEENSGNNNGNWNNTLPTDTVFSVGSFNSGNRNNGNMIAYCFTDIEGYSKAGKYIGNNSNDGPFVFRGFRPAFVIIKESSASGNTWVMFDNKRDPINAVSRHLRPNVNATEVDDADQLDFVSNGFKLRANQSNARQNNGSGRTYIYLAFAEQPFKYANAK